MPGSIRWKKLFPTKWHAVVFVLYMVVWINQGIFVTASQSSRSAYSYNTVTVVLLTEVLKLFVSIALYVKDHAARLLVREISNNVNMLMFYFVPALLYCLYNNLAFVNLSAFDPPTYYLLLQFRVVVTGIMFQIFFRKKLSRKHWLSLVLLTVGCMIKQLNLAYFSDHSRAENGTSANSNSEFHLNLNINIMLIFVQIVCSCVAGVYTEYLLKFGAAELNIFVQNIFMCVDSIICNAGVLLLQGDLVGAFGGKSLSFVFTFKVVIIIVNNAAIGIITSLFLKNLNSILKDFASALELIFTSVLCYMIFGTPIYVNTVLAISIVSYAVYLYSQNPIVNQPKDRFVLSV